MNKWARKITFPNVGVIQGSRVWRNSETGVEIIKGKNFKLNGFYYVAVPTRTAEGRMIVATRDSLKGARGAATYYVDWQMRTSIAQAYIEASLEDSDHSVSIYWENATIGMARVPAF
jgi:hypothetical protein